MKDHRGRAALGSECTLRHEFSRPQHGCRHHRESGLHGQSALPVMNVQGNAMSAARGTASMRKRMATTVRKVPIMRAAHHAVLPAYEAAFHRYRQIRRWKGWQPRLHIATLERLPQQ